MSTRTAARLAWALWALSVAFTPPTLLLQSVNDPATFWSGAFEQLVLLAFVTVGALVAARRPQNPIGWLFCAGTLASTLGVCALEYAVYTVITAPGALPGGDWLAWFGAWAQGAGWTLMVTFVLLLFPTGQLPAPRWRPVAWLVTGNLVFFTVVALFAPTNLDFRLPSARNPLGIALPNTVFDPLFALQSLVTGVTVVACAAAMTARFRHAQGEERQQLKWFAYAAVLGMVVIGVIVASSFVLPPAMFVTFGIKLGRALFSLSVAALPFAVGIAILKYRLYDIDLIINRTLIYGALTGTLALIYFSSVVVLQEVVRILAGQAQSEIVTVTATLVIAALFTPVRRGIQAAIDRRFYRRKYDAAKTLAAFSVKLRAETDLDALTERLLQVVDETMQPAHVSFWLKPTDGGRAKRGLK